MATNGDEFLILIKAQVTGDKAISQITKDVVKLNKAQKAGQAPMQLASKNTKQFGRIAQNTSFQLQDMIVQIGSGQDVMRVMSQQLPQLFIGMGAVGAAVGVVAAGLPLLIGLFRDADDATKEWSDTIGGLDEAMSGLGNLGSSFNLDAWAAEFNKVGAAAQQAMQTALEFQTVMLSSNARRAADSIASLSVPSGEDASFRAVKLGKAEEERLKALANAQSEYAASIGLTVDQTNALSKSIEDVKSSGGLDAVATQNALDILTQSAIETGELTEENDALFKQLTKMVEVQDRYAEATKTSAQAAQGYGVVLADVAAQGEKVSSAFGGSSAAGGGGDNGRARAEALQFEYEVFKKLNPEIAQYAERYTWLKRALDEAHISQAQFNEEMEIAFIRFSENSSEVDRVAASFTETAQLMKQVPIAVDDEFTAADEAMQIFSSTFDTAVNGVASGTQSMSDAFESMAKAILIQVGKLAVIQGIGGALSGAGGFWGNVGAALLAEKGAVISGGRHVTAYAKGGIVNGPTVFPMASGGSGSFGLMGERGAEGILPLARTSSGNLGVEAKGMSVTINNNAPGVDVRPRQDDNGLTIDVVVEQVSDAIRSGGNSITNALQDTYSLGRGRATY